MPSTTAFRPRQMDGSLKRTGDALWAVEENLVGEPQQIQFIKGKMCVTEIDVPTRLTSEQLSQLATQLTAMKGALEEVGRILYRGPSSRTRATGVRRARSRTTVSRRKTR